MKQFGFQGFDEHNADKFNGKSVFEIKNEN